MEDYLRRVNYYETDKMGITHHSNYIRYMEEARVHFLEQLGYSYARQEQEGLVSPVTGIDCQYKHSSSFNDLIRIRVRVLDYNGVKLTVGYTMTKQDTGELLFTGTSQHCYIDGAGRPVILRKQSPALDALLRREAEKNKEETT